MRMSQFIRRGAYRVWGRHLSVHSLLHRESSPSILDVGCGPGYFLREARRIYPRAKLSGLDYEPVLLDWVGVQEATLCQGSAEELPFEDRSFDLVACLQVLEHLSNPDKAIQEIHRVLKPGGFACIATPNLDCWSKRVAGSAWHGYRPDHIALRAASEWETSLKANGFQILEQGTTLFSGMPLLRLPPLILLSWIPLYIFGHFPWSGGESYLAFCRKRGAG
jgi:ubiquinone/menaquinone biosynthesis C-methylase UbiE